MSHTVCTSCNKNWLFSNEEMCNDCLRKKTAFDELFKITKSGGDIESIKDNLSELMISFRIILNDKQIKELCDSYYHSGELTSERLEDSNQLFLQLHHTNGMVPR